MARISLPKVRVARPKSALGRTARAWTWKMSYAEYLERFTGFGGTDIEKLLDGAADQLGRRFDDAQVTVWVGESFTRIDRVLWHPLTAVYADGIQHELRPEIETRDNAIRMQLEGMGWRVFSLNWRELIADPVGTVARVWYG